MFQISEELIAYGKREHDERHMAKEEEIQEKQIFFKLKILNPLPGEAYDVEKKYFSPQKRYSIWIDPEDNLTPEDLSQLEEQHPTCNKHIELRCSIKSANNSNERNFIIKKISINPEIIQATFIYTYEEKRHMRVHFYDTVNKETQEFICALIEKIEGKEKVSFEFIDEHTVLFTKLD